MTDLPMRLPSVAHARLPETYQAARTALEKSLRIDECKDWADKAAAMASYAKQAEDTELEKTAVRIRARAIRRCGELLKEFKAAEGRPSKSGGSDPHFRHEAAKEAGLSRDQKRTAVRVANVPEGAFEEQVESDDPPTIKSLAKQGTKSMRGEAKDLSVRTLTLGVILRLDEHIVIGNADVEEIVRGLSVKERVALAGRVARIQSWLVEFAKQLRKGSK